MEQPLWLLRLSTLSRLTGNNILELKQLMESFSIKKFEALIITGVGIDGSIEEYLDSLINFRLLMRDLTVTPRQVMIIPNQQDRNYLITFSGTFHMACCDCEFSPTKHVTLKLPRYEFVGLPSVKLEEMPPLTGQGKRIRVTHEAVDSWRIEGPNTPQSRYQILDYQASTELETSKVTVTCL